MNRSSLVSPILLIGLAMASEVYVFMSVAGPVRVVLGLWFVLVAPGWAVLRLLKLPMSVVAMVATAIAVSVSVNILLSLALFYARWWSVELATTILVAMIVVLVLVDLPVVRRAVGRRLSPFAEPEVMQP